MLNGNYKQVILPKPLAWLRWRCHSAELTALAAIHEGRYAQAFPSFGPERRGAPVLAFNRISAGTPIRVRSGVVKPDIVIVLDPGLVTLINVVDGLKPGGTLIVNSTKSIDEIKQEFNGDWKLAVVDASAIARQLLKVNIVNTTMLGARIKTTGVIKIESLKEPLEEKFGARAQANLDACRKAYDTTIIDKIIPDAQKKARTFPAPAAHVERTAGGLRGDRRGQHQVVLQETGNHSTPCGRQEMH
jgi:pyruvate ferredoxin oxidoreductase gamma subunit